MNDIERTKNLLKYHNERGQSIVSLTDMLEYLDGQRAISYDSMPNSSKIADTTGLLGVKRAELELKLKNAKRLVDIVDKALRSLTQEERVVVEQRYIYDISLKVIAAEMYVSEMTVSRNSKRVLEKLTKIIFG